MKILIAGAGIGGLALASFLEKAEIHYKIIEKERDWSKHGFSLGMWSNGRAILSKLGLSEQFDKSAIPYHKLEIKTFTGNALKSYSLKDFYINYGLGYSHIHRLDLHNWLLSGIDMSKLHMETTVNDISSTPKGMKVILSSGEVEIYDLVVGADGAHSAIRQKYFADHIEKYINWRVWYATPKSHISQAHVVTEYLEPSRLLNIFDDGNKSLAIFGSFADHHNFDEINGRIDRLKELFKKNPLTNQILSGLKDEDVLPTDLIEIQMEKWSKDGVVLLGDAAHAFEPFAGLGGSMALEDAYILFAEILKVNANYPLSAALQSYETKRKARIAKAWRVTKKMKTWATLRSKILYKFMNLLAPIIPTYYFSNDFIGLMNEDV